VVLIKRSAVKILLVSIVTIIGVLIVLSIVTPSREEQTSRLTHQIAKNVYSWPKIGLTIKLPDNFTARNELLVPGPNNPDIPAGIEIVRQSANGIETSSVTRSDFMYINIFEYTGNLDKFIQDVNSGNKYQPDRYINRNRELIETTQVGGPTAKWYIATAKNPYDTSKDYEVYFVNQKFGFIFRAQYSWDKNEVVQIVNGISLQ